MLKMVLKRDLSTYRSCRQIALQYNVLLASNSTCCLLTGVCCLCVCIQVHIVLIWMVLMVGWAHWCKSVHSQAVSSSFLSYSLLKSLWLLTYQGHAHPEWQHWSSMPVPSSTHLMGCFLEQPGSGSLHLYGSDLPVHQGWVLSSKTKESKNMKSPKPRKIKYKEGWPIPSFCMWTSHGCCKERDTSLPVPFLTALRAITWDKSSAHHFLLIPLKVLLMKPDPDWCSLLLLSAVSAAKGQVCLTSNLFFPSLSMTSRAIYFRVWSDSKPQCENVKGPWKICNYISDLEETINEMEFLGPLLCWMVCSSLPVSQSLTILMAQKSFYCFET